MLENMFHPVPVEKYFRTAVTKVSIYIKIFMLHVLRTCCTIVRKKCAMLSLMSTISLPVLKRPPLRTIQIHRQPVVTRWGTWLKGADYYVDNLTEVKNILNEFEGDGIYVKRAKEAVNDAGIAASLLKIKQTIFSYQKSSRR